MPEGKKVKIKKMLKTKLIIFAVSLGLFLFLDNINFSLAGNCGTNNTGTCMSGSTLNQCVSPYMWISGGNSCPNDQWCCAIPPGTNSPSTVTSSNFDYPIMEGIPGIIKAGEKPDFNQYVSGVYKFGLWAVGIAALLMLSIGAFMYLTSAGNNAAMGSAKGVIVDAIIGLILALVAWLLLNIINPDLVHPKGITGIAPTTSSTTEVPTMLPPMIISPASKGGSKAVSLAQTMLAQVCIYDQTKRNGCTGVPGYTDCSDLVDTTYKKAGCTSPGNTSATIGSRGEVIGETNTLKIGDVIAVPGHVVLCANNGCTTVIGAAGVGKNIKYSNGSYYTSQDSAKVVRAANYCPA
jgi:hypothetical protein